MASVCRHGAAQLPLAEQDEPAQALLFDRAHEALSVRPQVRTLRRLDAAM
jgi:hypothetical protein